MSTFTNPRVLRRFIIYMLVTTVVLFTVWTLFSETMERAPGDFETDMGSNRLDDGLLDEAMEHFNMALEEEPDHRGALMGRALVFMARKQHLEALAEFSYLIEFLTKNVDPDDRTGRATLAAAYANRGIVHDRDRRYEKALADYIQALKVDEGAVDGPDWIDKILYGTPQPSTVRKRAIYIYEQLKLPKDKRLMQVPELDADQRRYKPR